MPEKYTIEEDSAGIVYLCIHGECTGQSTSNLNEMLSYMVGEMNALRKLNNLLLKRIDGLNKKD